MPEQGSGSRGGGPGAELSFASGPSRGKPSWADVQTSGLSDCLFYALGLLWVLLDSIFGPWLAHSEIGT